MNCNISYGKLRLYKYFLEKAFYSEKANFVTLYNTDHECFRVAEILHLQEDVEELQNHLKKPHSSLNYNLLPQRFDRKEVFCLKTFS